jgi:Fe-S-cluster containining protein
MSLLLEKPQCRQCGTCCRKGGPALHAGDAPLLEKKQIRAQDLCTFRAGELVRDEAEGRVVPLPGEIVKIAAPAGARPDDWTCRFLLSNNHCFLYHQHPAECQALFCQAPEALTAMSPLSGAHRLDRAAACRLLGAPAWWPELIETHEERCGYAALTRLAPDLDTQAEARREFLEIIEFDRAYRELMVEKQAALPLELDFLLGRPLLRTIIMFNLDARPGPDGSVNLVRTMQV